MKSKLLCLMTILLLLSCGGNSNNKASEYEQISMENIKPLSDIIDTMRYVSLKDDTHKIFFSGRIDKIMTKGDTIYMLDVFESKTLRAYKKDGTFLFNVGRVGKGPGEYVDMITFTIDNQYFYCVNNATNKLLVYNIDNGKYIKQLDLPRWVGDIALFEDGKFMLYEGAPSIHEDPSKIPAEDKFKIFITDQNLKIIDKLFPYCEDDCRALSSINVFTENKDKIVLSQMAKDTIVVFDKSSYLDRDYYVVDLGSYKASMEDKQDYERLRKTKYIMPPVYIVDSMAIGDVSLPITGRNNYWMHGAFVYNMSNKQVYQNGNVGDMLQGKIPMDNKLVLPIKGMIDNEIISVIDDYERYQALVKLGFPAAPKHLEKQLEEGEPLLLFYTLKNMTE